jgi:hypothetical protein
MLLPVFLTSPLQQAKFSLLIARTSVSISSFNLAEIGERLSSESKRDAQNDRPRTDR